MKRTIVSTLLMLFALNAWSDHHQEHEKKSMEAAAMQAMQAAATPGEPHARLADSVGKFTAAMEMYMEPGGEPMLTEMTVERKMDLSGRVLVEHWRGEVMGQPFEGLARTGFDNVTQRYWSTWTDSMSTGLMLMYGTWDADKQALLLAGEHVHPVSGQTYKLRSVGKYPKNGGETLQMFEDHGQGEFKSMAFTLTPQ